MSAGVLSLGDRVCASPPFKRAYHSEPCAGLMAGRKSGVVTALEQPGYSAVEVLLDCCLETGPHQPIHVLVAYDQVEKLPAEIV